MDLENHQNEPCQDEIKAFVLDRIENNILICEDLKTEKKFEFERDTSLQDIKEGDVLTYKDNKLVYDEKQTKDRKKYIENLFNNLFD